MKFVLVVSLDQFFLRIPAEFAGSDLDETDAATKSSAVGEKVADALGGSFMYAERVYESN